MRKLFKLIGVIAIAAVIGLGMVSCGEDEEEDNTKNSGSGGGSSVPSELIGKWTSGSGSGSYTIEIRSVGVLIITTSSTPPTEAVYDIVVSGRTVILKHGNESVGIFDYSIDSTYGSAVMYISNAGGTIAKTIAASSFTKQISAPANVKASASSSSNSITISWNSVSGASIYNVYRSTTPSGPYSNIGNTSSTSYTDSGLSQGIIYYYQVSASGYGGESDRSSTVYASISSGGNIPNNPDNSGQQALNPPSNVSAYAESSNSITITWNSVSGASGYYVYRNTTSSGYYSLIDQVYSTTSYTDYYVDSGTTYYYKVSVFRNGTESDMSSYASATTSGVGVPSDSGNIDLSSNSWYSNNISSYATHNYKFYANSGTTYTIQWEDLDNSSYTADIRVGLRGEGVSSYVVEVADRNPTNNFQYTVSTAGYYIIEVQGSYGSYRIKYSSGY